jgi:hypothetical protein
VGAPPCPLRVISDISQYGRHVRFTPKADMCSATRDVRFVPEADMDPDGGVR